MLSRTGSEQAGLAHRRQLKRVDLAALAERNFDPIEVLREAARGRLLQLLPVKFKLMSQSPFAFYRGSVEVMAADLAAGKQTGINVQLCGDAHVKNFGFFAGPAADIVPDMNDFDQTWRGPWEWDIKRMAASVVLAGRGAGDSHTRCRHAALVFTRAYCAWIRRFAQLTTLEMARHRVTRDWRDAVVRAALDKAERDTPVSSLQKLTRMTAKGPRFRYQKDVVLRVDGKTRKAVLGALKQYRQTLSHEHRFLFDRYHVVDVAMKVVGTGSVGTRDYVVLLFGYDETDPLFLQIKEEPPSAYARYIDDPGAPKHQGERVVCGQRMMQVLSDLLLGWCSIEGRDYLVRQLSDHKSSIDAAALQGKRLVEYGRVCAEMLAKGHARSGDPVMLAAYLGSSEKAPRALQQFALLYADQVEADYNEFRRALKRGVFPRA
jgi:uncharacterized protein (DUF2252 family)